MLYDIKLPTLTRKYLPPPCLENVTPNKKQQYTNTKEFTVDLSKWLFDADIYETINHFKMIDEHVYSKYETLNSTFPDVMKELDCSKGGVMIVCGDKFLGVKEISSDRWGIPKGQIEKRLCENYREAWQRELYEETGLILPQTTRFLGYKQVDNYMIEIVSIDAITPLKHHKSDEIHISMWIPFDQVETLSFNRPSSTCIHTYLKSFNRHIKYKSNSTSVLRVNDFKDVYMYYTQLGLSRMTEQEICKYVSLWNCYSSFADVGVVGLINLQYYPTVHNNHINTMNYLYYLGQCWHESHQTVATVMFCYMTRKLTCIERTAYCQSFINLMDSLTNRCIAGVGDIYRQRYLEMRLISDRANVSAKQVINDEEALQSLIWLENNRNKYYKDLYSVRNTMLYLYGFAQNRRISSS